MNLCVRNRQRARHVDLRLLKKIAERVLILTEIETEDLGIYLVGATEMTGLNETFLQHAGSTDVVTFDYSETENSSMHGEIFISVDDARTQSKKFKTTWQSEIVRYLVHGILHLRGHDDLQPVARRKMKREENRLVKILAREFSFGRLSHD